jgi:hypothetical protein
MITIYDVVVISRTTSRFNVELQTNVVRIFSVSIIWVHIDNNPHGREGGYHRKYRCFNLTLTQLVSSEDLITFIRSKGIKSYIEQ